MNILALHFLRRNVVSLLTAACLLANVAVAYHFMGSSNLIPRVNHPVRAAAYGDYALEFYTSTLGSRFLAETGQHSGYDPRFLSGYTKTPSHQAGGMLFELPIYVFQDLPPGLVFNWTIFAVLAALPFLFHATAVNFGLDPWERLVALALLLVPPPVFEPGLAVFTIMQAIGMIAFIFASFLSVYSVSLVYRFLVGGTWSAVVPLVVSALLVWLVYPLLVLITALPVTYLYLTRLRRFTSRPQAVVGLVPVLFFMALLPWIDDSDLSLLGGQTTALFSIAPGSLLGPIASFLQASTVLARVPIVFAGIGILLWNNTGERERARFFLLQVLAVAGLAYYGDRLGLTAPGRLALPLALYLFLPAAVAAVRLARSTLDEVRALLNPRQRRLGAAVLLLLLPALVQASFPPSVRQRATLPSLQTLSQYKPVADLFIAWLEQNTDASGRILLEESQPFSYPYFGADLPALLPLYMGREFANSPGSLPLKQKNALGFIEGTLQGRSVRETSPRDLAILLERYNVKWLVCWTTEAKEYLAQGLPPITFVDSFDKFALYRIDGPGSYFLKGTGAVTARPNSISVTNAIAEDDTIVLRYHWDAKLKVPEPLELFPYEVPGDPVPFIGVRRPTPVFRITYGD